MKGWKTVAFNLATLALASPDIMALIPPRATIYVLAIGNLLLRAVTTTSIGKPE